MRAERWIALRRPAGKGAENNAETLGTARGSFHLRIDFSMSNELDQF